MSSPAEADSISLFTRLRLAAYRYPLLWLLLPLLLGSSLGNWWSQALNPIQIELRAWLCLMLAVALIVLSLKRWPRQRTTLLSGLSLATWSAAVGLGVSLALWQTPPRGDDLSSLASRKPTAIALRGTIASVAEWRPNLNYRPEQDGSQEWLTTWRIDCTEVRDRSDWKPIRSTSQLTVPGRVDELLPGDRIQLFGSVRAIVPPTNPGGYDYARHAQTQGEFVRLSADDRRQVTLLGFDPRYMLGRCRGLAVRAVDANLRRWISFEQAPLAAALVFGQRTQVDWDDRQELMATGTLHLLAISGLHVAIVAGAIYFLAYFLQLPASGRAAAVLICCALYAALAGGEPPVLRAVVLITLVMLARTWGRLGRLPNLLSAAAILLLFIDTHHVGEVGVHLSFLAVASLSLFGKSLSHPRREAVNILIDQRRPRIYRWLRWWGKQMWAALQLSGWVWLMTCPLIWFTFHVISPVAIPLNVLLSAPLTLSLLCGLLTGLLGAFPWLAAVLGWISGGCLALISWLVSVGHSVPLGHWWLPAPSMAWVVVFYLAIAIWLLVARERPRAWLALGLGLWIVVGVLPHARGPRGYLSSHEVQQGVGLAHPPSIEQAESTCLQVTFIDVGHGTSVVIEFPTGPVWLYDAGRLGADETSHLEIANALWALPTARIDHLLISHADSDHYNAVHGLLQRFNVGRVISTERFWTSESEGVQQLHASIRRQELQEETWYAGKEGKVGEVKWRVLHPSDSRRAESDNASSLCLLLEHAGRRIFLPGDLEGTGLLELIDLPPRPCHVLMAPHHGSISHDPKLILDWCLPETVIVSGNHRAVRQEVLEQFHRVDTNLAITFRDGAIQVSIDREGHITRRHWNGNQWQSL